MLSHFGGLHCSLLALLVLCSGGPSVKAEGQEHACPLPANIRPVVYLSGFGGGALFDSANGFSLEFPDAERDPGVDDGLGFFGNITADLSLSLNWSAQNLVQEKSSIGPEAFPGDELPGSAGPLRDLLVQVLRNAVTTNASGAGTV